MEGDSHPHGYGSIPIDTFLVGGLFTSIDPSYFDVNRRGTRVFDPYRWDHRYGCQRLDRLEWDAQPKKWTKNHS